MKEVAVLDQVVFTRHLIMAKIRKYAQFLNQTYQQQNLVIIAVLNGAAFFLVYLTRYLKINFQLDFVAVSSYQSNSKKAIKFYKEIKINVANQNLLLVEDIVDSGQTCQIIYQFFQKLQPKSIRFCALVKGFQVKKEQLPCAVDFLLSLPQNVWIVGFGIDFEEQFRNLADIYSIRWSKSKKLIKTK